MYNVVKGTIMVQITTYGKIDSLAISEQISMPLVILKQNTEKGQRFIGFIPAITSRDIISNTLDECKNTLKQEAMKIIGIMAKDNVEFPFFPTKNEILENYKNVIEISFIKIKSKKRKNG